MAVDAVQKDNTPKKMSYLNSLIFGGTLGYAAKWAIPITKSEKDKPYKDEISQIRKKSRQARLDEIKAIEKNASEIPGADEFIRLNKENKLYSYEIKKLKAPLNEKLMALLNRINNAASSVKTQGRRNLELNTKDIRPTGAFVAIGMGAALGLALIRNVSIEIRKNASKFDS